jgi:inner membrane protein
MTLSVPLMAIRPLYFWAVVGGYWSHLWIDMLNIRGVDLFWPAPVRLVTPGNRHWRFMVGGKGEMILLAVLLGLAAALVPLSQIGFRDGLQRLLRNFDIAREQYQRQAGTHWYQLDLDATDNLTLQPVKGKFPVVGVWQNGLIVERDGELRAVGPSPTHHNLYPLQARLIAGEPLRVVAERVDMRGHSLRWLLSRIDQNRPYYLLGEVEIPDGRGPAITGRLDSVDSYNPASYRGGILRLHYARAPELGPWLDLVAVRGEMVVQFWLKPGEAAVTLGPGEEREVERIPKQLKRFL